MNMTLCQAPLAPYACIPDRSRGRLFDEPSAVGRSPFQRDRDRIIHAAAFRRLSSKTQVFVYHEGDSYRTRLSHSLEVSQIARSIARELHLNEDLAEALALAHDLGHPPFGHAGEDVLKRCMAPFGGFDHNAQSLKVVTRLERHYADFDGLNLSWETLEGLVKHNGPIVGEVPGYIVDFDAEFPLNLGEYSSLEAQAAAVADDIAYNNHDIADGLRAGLFGLDEIRSLPLVGQKLTEVESLYPGLSGPRLIHETIRRMINAMVSDVVVHARANLAAFQVDDIAAVRQAGRALVEFSPTMRDTDRALKDFLFPNMYRHHKVMRAIIKARRVVDNLFGLLLSEPRLLPADWRRRCGGPGTLDTAQAVCDYVAGMTDRFALDEHARLFDPKVNP
ncbi:MAG: deoxyguanosinetriphosphate triphosphohydrolase [Rhodospirillaceae bacterium]|nr:deoxyguanosinetriphosphate triphosphohydrolase [Rhodospirillaceae bacterium]